jgi:hypothetical protein
MRMASLVLLLTCVPFSKTSQQGEEKAIIAIKKLGGRVEGSPVKGIRLSGRKVTDADLARLEGLTKLEVFFLARTPVTDAGLAHLKGLRNLERLFVEDTQVTEKGCRQLAAIEVFRKRPQY